MSRARQFLEIERETEPKRPVSERVLDWKEIYERANPELLPAQAGRCMDCGVPFCMQGCPLGNQIPDWNRHAADGDLRRAFDKLRSTNNFPEFTGRLCPAPCEAACTLAINDDAVTIEAVEKAIIEHAFAEGWVTPIEPLPPTGKKVAVVGSGPAGLAAAAQLRRAGHAVTVFERADEAGGLLRFGIPDFKMEKGVLDRRLALMRAEGVEFALGVDVGADIAWADLHANYDAVLVAVGATRPRELPIEGRDLPGVHLAMEYLTAQNLATSRGERSPINAEGKHVVILGGGDTGADCLGTAHRQGAASVRQIEIVPEPPKTRAGDNPWPWWPRIFRVSPAHQEGGERGFEIRTDRFVGDGAVARIDATRLDDGTKLELQADLVLLAIGFVGAESERLSAGLGVATRGQGRVVVDSEFRTNVEGVYAVGDAQRGASLIVWAISDGREAARVVDRDLGGGQRLRTRGREVAW